MALLKFCTEPYCNELLEQGSKYSKCKKCFYKLQKERMATQYEDVNKFYNSKRWRSTRDKMRKENVFCEVCKEVGIKGVLATEVHHLEKVTMFNQSTLYNENELISVCHAHHVMVEDMTKEELIVALQDGSLDLRKNGIK